MKDNPSQPYLGAGKPAGRRQQALWKPLVAMLRGVFLLSGGLDTLASWGTTKAIGTGSIQAGELKITGATTTINLHSQITVGQRSYVSTTSCPTAAPYTECRDVSATLGSERLVPGDKLTITRTATVSTQGNNMQGNVMVDLSKVLPNTGAACPVDLSNDYACAATITASLTKPDNTTVAITSAGGWVTTAPVTASTGQGTYTVTWTMQVAPNNAGADWLAKLTDKAVDFGSLDLKLTQT